MRCLVKTFAEGTLTLTLALAITFQLALEALFTEDRREARGFSRRIRRHSGSPLQQMLGGF